MNISAVGPQPYPTDSPRNSAPASVPAVPAVAAASQAAAGHTSPQNLPAPPVPGAENELTFVMDPRSHRAIMQVIDRKTHEIVMQLPPEYVVRMAEEIDRNSGTPGR